MKQDYLIKYLVVIFAILSNTTTNISNAFCYFPCMLFFYYTYEWNFGRVLGGNNLEVPIRIQYFRILKLSKYQFGIWMDST